jgi:hypothetical protein
MFDLEYIIPVELLLDDGVKERVNFEGLYVNEMRYPRWIDDGCTAERAGGVGHLEEDVADARLAETLAMTLMGYL